MSSHPPFAFDLLVRAPSAILADGSERACAVAVADGRIAAILPRDVRANAHRFVDLAADEVLLPGLVDTHVHVNEPGRTEWEGFASATAAAAAGGVTTLVDMPLNSVPPTIDVDALEVKRAAAAQQCRVDVGFWGGVVPNNMRSLRALHEAGVFGFKAFLADSGVAEFPPLSATQLAAALTVIASFDGLLIAHAEGPAELASAPPASGRSYAAFLASRPAAAERTAVEHLIDAARRTGARVHVVHLSSTEALQAVSVARAGGVRISAETCPHYLTITADDIPDGATQYKCCPPIRGREHQDALWLGLANGDIDIVVSDHSPCPPELKLPDEGDFAAAWGGIASLQLGLPVVWTAARARTQSLSDVVGWMSRHPADLVGLASKGRIEVGADADLVAFAPDAPFVVDTAELRHRHPVTPYAGRELTGVVRRTWLRGQEVHGPDAVDDHPGHLLRRAEAVADG
ncbi:MAG TPA: allantoinase AllB [Jatrophihabitans sp.]|nr:allantoinase AllB [Jatrophihabitans sp.]